MTSPPTMTMTMAIAVRATIEPSPRARTRRHDGSPSRQPKRPAWKRVARRIACLGLIGVSVARAASAERLPAKMYSSTDGLASNSVHRIVQDSRGFLWMGANDGVSRFDGYEFKNLRTREGLPHPIVSDVLESRDGGI